MLRVLRGVESLLLLGGMGLWRADVRAGGIHEPTPILTHPPIPFIHTEHSAKPTLVSPSHSGSHWWPAGTHRRQLRQGHIAVQLMVAEDCILVPQVR